MTDFVSRRFRRDVQLFETSLSCVRCFGFTPDQVLARTGGTEIRPAPAGFSVGYGSLCLGLVSVAAYSIWAFKLIPGTGPMYTAIAAIYIGLSGVLLSRLVAGSGAIGRFALLFAVAFLAYAVAWCAFWFGLKGKHLADLWGAVVGLAVMTWLLRRAFGRRTNFILAFLVLFVCHSLGYYLGGALYAQVHGALGRLLWGAAHGVGFGAGLGYVLFHCQEPLKLQLQTVRPL